MKIGPNHSLTESRVRLGVGRRCCVAFAGVLVLAPSGCSGRTAEPAADVSSGALSVPSSSPGSARLAGPWLAYQAPAGEGDGIFLVQTDGNGAHQIATDVPGEQIHPDWSPTGEELAFIVADDTQEVWVSDADGSHARRVAACSGACLAYDFVTWMPSGRELLMMRYDGLQSDAGVPASSSLELLDLSAGTSHDVSKSGAHQLFSAPRVSPDGTSYCVTTEIGDIGEGPTGSAVAVGKMSGGAVHTVSKPRGWGSYCDWRPTAANQIVFTDHDLSIFADMGVSSNLFAVNADGSHRKKLTHFATGKMRATQPRWTPDGTHILFTAVDGDGSLANRHLASTTATGDQIQSATGKLSVTGTHPTLQPSEERMATPSAATAASELVGEWQRTTTCQERVRALKRAGLGEFAAEHAAGEGWIPGVASVDQLRDANRPCDGAMPLTHSHFFSADGRFGSRDADGNEVDDGTYKLTAEREVIVTKEFGDVTFHFDIRAEKLFLTPVLPDCAKEGCFAAQWAVAVACPGLPWQRAE
jgi:Tol biopolymer transport system component